ncbi:MAG: hypothetical protein NVS3B26_30430 [Mycobacteriales bacterium]
MNETTWLPDRLPSRAEVNAEAARTCARCGDRVLSVIYGEPLCGPCIGPSSQWATVGELYAAKYGQCSDCGSKDLGHASVPIDPLDGIEGRRIVRLECMDCGYVLRDTVIPR